MISEPLRVWPTNADFLAVAMAAKAVLPCVAHPEQLLRQQGTDAARDAYEAIKDRYRPSLLGEYVNLMDDMDDVIRLHPTDCLWCASKAK